MLPHPSSVLLPGIISLPSEVTPTTSHSSRVSYTESIKEDALKNRQLVECLAVMQYVFDLIILRIMANDFDPPCCMRISLGESVNIRRSFRLLHLIFPLGKAFTRRRRSKDSFCRYPLQRLGDSNINVWPFPWECMKEFCTLMDRFSAAEDFPTLPGSLSRGQDDRL